MFSYFLLLSIILSGLDICFVIYGLEYQSEVRSSDEDGNVFCLPGQFRPGGDAGGGGV